MGFSGGSKRGLDRGTLAPLEGCIVWPLSIV
jgi:hypothetical protein